MAHSDHVLRPDSFERLREQLATAAALCDHGQILTLADDLHDAIRRRRANRYEPSFDRSDHRLHQVC